MDNVKIKEIKETIERHQHRLSLYKPNLRKANLYKANLSGADLYGANLCEANLHGANLSNANLRGANLRGADLYGAELHEAELYGADLYGADLCEADLYKANLGVANLYKAILSGANLYKAILSGADLYGAELGGANLYKANLFGACNVPFIPYVCPDFGAFTGFKKAHGFIVVLEIPEDAQRLSATGRKCRCDKAKVIDIQNMDGTNANITSISSDWDNNFVYQIGEEVRVMDFDKDRWNECSRGIHFFINRQEAVDYVR